MILGCGADNQARQFQVRPVFDRIGACFGKIDFHRGVIQFALRQGQSRLCSEFITHGLAQLQQRPFIGAPRRLDGRAKFGHF